MSKKDIPTRSNSFAGMQPTMVVNFFPLTHQVPKSSFFAKVSLSSSQYPELSHFRQQISQKNRSFQQAYTTNKKNVFIYKLIFLFFGLLFTFLGSIVLYKTGALWSHAYFNIGYQLIKPIMTLLCVLFAGVSFIISFSMRTDKETVHHFVRKSLNQLARTNARKKIELGLNRFFYVGKRYRQWQAYAQFYQESKNKIADQKEETLQLIDSISSSSFDRTQKEVLFNQTIAELNDKLQQIVLSFKHSPQHHFHVENF